MNFMNTFSIVASIMIIIGIVTLIALNSQHKYDAQVIVKKEIIPAKRPIRPRPRPNRGYWPFGPRPDPGFSFT